MNDPLDLFRAAKARADASADDLVQMEAYIADRMASGKWTDQDADEYRAAVTDILRNGPDSAREAAREFWSCVLGSTSAAGINARIRAAIKTKETTSG